MTQSQEQYEQLTAYLDGELAEAQAREVEQLLARDADARRLLAELRATSRLVASLPKAPAPPGLAAAATGRLERQALFGESAVEERHRSGRRWRVRVLAVAAALMLMLTAGWFLLPGIRIGDDRRNVVTLADGEAPARKSLATKGSPSASLQDSYQTAAQPRGEKGRAASAQQPRPIEKARSEQGQAAPGSLLREEAGPETSVASPAEAGLPRDAGPVSPERAVAGSPPSARQRAAGIEGETVAVQAEQKTKGPDRAVVQAGRKTKGPDLAVLARPAPDEAEAVAQSSKAPTGAVSQKPRPGEQTAVQLPQAPTAAGPQPPEQAAGVTAQRSKAQTDAEPDASGRAAYDEQGQATGSRARPGERGSETGGRAQHGERGPKTGGGARHGENGHGTGSVGQQDGNELDAADRDWPVGRRHALNSAAKGGAPSEGGPASFDELLAGNVLTNDDLRRMTVTCAARQVVAVSDAQTARRLRRHVLDFMKSHGVTDASRQTLPEPIASSQSFYMLAEADEEAVEGAQVLANLPERMAFELVESLRRIASEDPASISLDRPASISLDRPETTSLIAEDREQSGGSWEEATGAESTASVAAENGAPPDARPPSPKDAGVGGGRVRGKRMPSAETETPEAASGQREKRADEARASHGMITLGIELSIRPADSFVPTSRPVSATTQGADRG